MKTIPLTQGQVAIVDDEDYAMLAGFKWYAWWSGHRYYALRRVPKADGTATTLAMHRQVMSAGRCQEVDHENGDGLDNRRHNLRLASSSQNKQNRRRVKASGFKGVYWCRHTGRWQARIGAGEKRNGKARSLFLGRFDLPEEAARAYDAAAIKYFGAFARLNFPTGL